MKLADVEMIPGVVVDDEDPKFLGRLKISAPGEFDVDSMDINDMFWVYPFPVGGYQSFSHMLKGSKVWLIKNTKNYYEYWYLPYFEMNANTFNLVNSKKKYDADVLVSRSDGSNNIQMYYNPEDGINQKIGFASINIMPDGTISITTGGAAPSAGTFHTNSKNNEIGYDGGEYPRQFAVMGENLHKLLDELNGKFKTLATTAAPCPFTSHLAKTLNEICDTISKYTNGGEKDIKAQYTKVN